MNILNRYFYIILVIATITCIVVALAIYDQTLDQQLIKEIKEELTLYTPKELAQFDNSLTEEETIILNEFSEGLYKNDSKRDENDILKEASPQLYDKLINLFKKIKEKRENLSDEGKNFYVSLMKEGHTIAKNRGHSSNYKLIMKYVITLTSRFNMLNDKIKDEITQTFPTIKALSENDYYESEFDKYMDHEEFRYSIMRILKVLQLFVIY
uniref:Lipoprotein n=1 Tax=Parastrongyloides trichosuri TaxID=131310 RepID=A0A0N4ZU21_PARTI